ncbi:MAG TPA: hypothetical protein PKD85_18360 [Saprospiraceae bacterium]|nr:hypothetical protein [Saprospiraceae bacterium]
MQTTELLKEINRLPKSKRLTLVEEIIESIVKEEQNLELEQASKALYDDYKNDKELTAFVSLDLDSFYESK